MYGSRGPGPWSPGNDVRNEPALNRGIRFVIGYIRYTFFLSFSRRLPVVMATVVEAMALVVNKSCDLDTGRDKPDIVSSICVSRKGWVWSSPHAPILSTKVGRMRECQLWTVSIS